MNDVCILERSFVDPFARRISSIEKELLNVFSDPFFNDFFSMTKNVRSYPKINIKEKDDCFILEAIIPGINKKNLKINAFDNKLILVYEKEKEEKEEGKYIFREVSKRSFKRIIPFNKKVIPEKISSKFVDGILILEIPKEKKEKLEGVNIKL